MWVTAFSFKFLGISVHDQQFLEVPAKTLEVAAVPLEVPAETLEVPAVT